MITYKRPKQCQEVLDQINAIGCSTKGILCINGSDEYPEINAIPVGWTIIKNQGNPGFIATLNNVFHAYPKEKFYGFIADDEFIFTPEWDKKLIDAAGDWGLSNSNENWQSRARFQSYCCIGGELARSVGFLALPTCWHWYGFDNFWEYIFHHLKNRKFCYGVKSEHKHWRNGKVEKDDCHVAGDSKENEDKQAFMEWLLSDGKDLIEKIRGKMK